MVVRPSDIHTYAYCPRLFFFESHMVRRRGVLERLRLLLGRVFHRLFYLYDLLRGYKEEVELSATMGSVTIRGRADAVKRGPDRLVVVERKSSSPPARGAWASDVLQAAAYAYALKAGGSEQPIEIDVVYPGATRRLLFTSDLASMLAKAIDELVLVKEHGIVPAPKRGKRCLRCPYREPCELLDQYLYADEVYEPGDWLRELNVIEVDDTADP